MAKIQEQIQAAVGHCIVSLIIDYVANTQSIKTSDRPATYPEWLDRLGLTPAFCNPENADQKMHE